MENHEENREKMVTNLTIATRNSDGEQCYHAEDEVEANILTPAGDQLETEIEDTKDGMYTITYKPQCVGQHRLEIQVNGQPLTDSPWVVQVIPHQYQFAFQFGSQGEEQGQFNAPSFIVINNKDERVAVFDDNNNRSQIFNFEGKFLNEKPFFSVIDVCDGEFLFMEQQNGKLFLCREDGEHIRSLDMGEGDYGVFESNGSMIACFDEDEKTMKVLTDGKQEVQSFSCPNCDGEEGFVLHHQDKFFVCYQNAHYVRVFNNAGVHLFDIGEKGSGDGQLMNPSSLAIDKFNHLIVCDTSNQRLQVFTLEGKLVSKIEESFFNDSYLDHCVVSNTGYLFVTDRNRDCVYVFN